MLELCRSEELLDDIFLPEVHKLRREVARWAFGVGLACSTVVCATGVIHSPSAHMTGAHIMPTAQKVVDPAEVSSIKQELSRENTRDSPVVQELRRQVANAFVLYANYKHYHWQTYGPLFRDLHKLFDRLAKDVLPTLDEFAERVRMIGQDPPGHLVEAVDLASVAVAAPHSTMREMVDEADRHLLVVISEIRRAAKVADEHGDPGTVDLFSRVVQIHEKHEWWMRDLLRTGDGLCT
jgi:starvation-inducible DNA-binding protein